MRLKNLVLAAAAVVGAVGLTGAAAAAIQNSHVLTVQLPDGATARIRYFGDTPPEVRVEPSGFAPLAWSDSASGFLEPSLFGLQQALAEMDREADLMLAQTERLTSAAPPAPGLMAADLSRPPPGASGYTVVSSLTPHGVCSRSVEYRVGSDGRPQVVTRTSGACGASAGGSALRPAAPNGGARLTRVAFPS